MITALYASLLAILLFILSIRVIGLRGNPAFAFIAQGKGDDELLQRGIRAHGNLTEYVPTMLILLFFLESSGAARHEAACSRWCVLAWACDARNLHGLHEIQYASPCRWYRSDVASVGCCSCCVTYAGASAVRLFKFQADNRFSISFARYWAT